MPRLANGTYQRPRNWLADAKAGVPMDPTLFDQDAKDMATAISDTPSRSEVYTKPQIDQKFALVASGGVVGSTLAAYGIADAFTKAEVNTLVSDAKVAITGAAASALDTLAEIGAALGNDPNVIANLQTSVSGKLPTAATTAYTRTLLDDPDAATARSTLGLGTAATMAATAFAGATHVHAIADVTGLQAVIDALTAALAAKAAAVHAHAIADVTGLQAALDALATAISTGSGTVTIASVTGLQAALDALTPQSRTIVTSGLASGGGDLSANRTITVPKATSAEAIAGTLDSAALTPAGGRAHGDARYARTVMGQAIDGTGNIDLTSVVPQVSSSTSAAETIFPVGTYVPMHSVAATPALNAVVLPRNNAGVINDASGTLLSGTWRSRGVLSASFDLGGGGYVNGAYFVQRVA